jgi:hypothetical protein
VSVVCCQVEVSATSWSLVQRSPTDCGVSLMCVTMKPGRNEEAQAHIGLSSHMTEREIVLLQCKFYYNVGTICVCEVWQSHDSSPSPIVIYERRKSEAGVN